MGSGWGRQGGTVGGGCEQRGSCGVTNRPSCRARQMPASMPSKQRSTQGHLTRDLGRRDGEDAGAGTAGPAGPAGARLTILGARRGVR